MKFIKLYIFLLISALVLLSSCEDELLYDNGYLGEGEVSISGIVEFEPVATSLGSRATAGDAIKDIESLSVIIFNADEDTTFNALYNLSNFTVDRVNDDLPTDYYPNTPAETKTARAKFTLPDIHVGKYYMYVVANMGELTEDQVNTPQKLKTISLKWKPDNIAANNQMFGYFTPGENGESDGFDAPKVTVSRASNVFHAWVKRAASKVTVVYDPSGLHNDIFIYIHKVTIRDIPNSCYLGAYNQPTDTLQLISKGESIYYNRAGEQLAEDHAPDLKQYESWLRLGRGSGLKGGVDENGNPHTETETALYFYENVQDLKKEFYDNDKYDKRQQWDNVGQIINKPGQEDYKDNVPCGTYIEVEGYYISNHAPVISNGPIKYRFMLGQDEKYDYNAFRNRHYKLTLGFKGYANQADWHIEYIEENPDIYVPAKYYVSYIYNHKALFPVRLTGNCTNLEAEIIQNDWHPYDHTPDSVPDAGELGTGGESFQWNWAVWDNNKGTGSYYYGRRNISYDKGKTGDTTMCITPPHAGFLALTAPIDDPNTPLSPNLFTDNVHFYSYTGASGHPDSRQALANYYYANGSNTGNGITKGGYNKALNYNKGVTEINLIPQNIRTYDVSQQKSLGSGRNDYAVDKLQDGTTTLHIPLWTRPKSMIRISGFTGNNPYETYQRKAIVRFRATFELPSGSKVVRVKDVPVYQVRRVVNPKAVWRKWNNNDAFDVTLMIRETAGAEKFSELTSEGSWKAYVSAKNGEDFISLTGGNQIVNDTVFGDTDTPISFKINFKGVTDQGESNCAIVTVMYHGFNCTHTIYVRQGYNRALQIVKDGAHWSSYALYAGDHDYKVSTGTAKGVLTKNPLALGSFFKRGNLREGILIKNNDKYPNLSTVGNNASFELADVNNTKKSKTWGNIYGANVYKDSNNKDLYPADHDNWTYSWPEIEAEVNGKTRVYALPTNAEFEAIANQDYGFGVMYADGATETAVPITTAFGYQDLNNDGLENEYGMRGVIVYNPTNANQVFFPVGAKGIGRRTLQGSAAGYEGTLRYGAVASVLDQNNNVNNQYRPICYNLPGNPGAIYWLREASAYQGMVGWDMNYFDLNFNGYDYAACRYDNGDALPIKLVWIKDKE